MIYLHHIPGRIRVRSAAVKRNPARALAVARWLESLNGVETVNVNPLTGGILLYYNAGVADGEKLIAEMRRRNWIGARPRRPSLERAVAKVVLKYALEAAVERSLFALAAAVL